VTPGPCLVDPAAVASNPLSPTHSSSFKQLPPVSARGAGAGGGGGKSARAQPLPSARGKSGGGEGGGSSTQLQPIAEAPAAAAATTKAAVSARATALPSNSSSSSSSKSLISKGGVASGSSSRATHGTSHKSITTTPAPAVAVELTQSSKIAPNHSVPVVPIPPIALAPASDAASGHTSQSKPPVAAMSGSAFTAPSSSRSGPVPASAAQAAVDSN
jgi:hypothetical protein